MRERCACRDRTSSRVAAPHARATSRLTAPSPSPAPRVTANSPPRPRRRLASPSACARRYAPSHPALERHPRPDGSFSISRRASSRRASSRDRGDARDTPRRSRRSLSARAHRSVRSPPLPVPDRHRTKPLPRRRLPRRRSPSPSAPLAAPRCDSRRDAPSSPSRTHLSSSTTHERKRLDAASRIRPHDAEAARRPSPERSRRPSKAPAGRAASAGSRGCTPVGSRAAHTREIALEKSRFRAFTSRWPKEAMTGTRAGATRG